MTEPPPGKLRLFYATTIPEGHLRAVAEAMAPHRAAFEGARWAPVENQHLTLKFLGSTPADLLADVVEAGGRVAEAMRPSQLRLTGLGAFPSTNRARVLWAGIDDAAGLLSRLAADLDEALGPLGFEAEERAFRPHLTLARFRRPVRVPRELPDPAAELEPFVVDHLILFRSHLHPKGARYEAIATFALGAS